MSWWRHYIEKNEEQDVDDVEDDPEPTPSAAQALDTLHCGLQAGPILLNLTTFGRWRGVLRSTKGRHFSQHKEVWIVSFFPCRKSFWSPALCCSVLEGFVAISDNWSSWFWARLCLGPRWANKMVRTLTWLVFIQRWPYVLSSCNHM